MTIDKRPDTRRTDPSAPSSNQIKGGPAGKIPSTGNPSKAPSHIPSQGPSPRQPYGH